jgi:hypothetical protein
VRYLESVEGIARSHACRKYRILDDCARLREVIEMFPKDRHFIPSVLFILWGEAEAEALPGDLLRMVRSFHMLKISSTTLTRNRWVITRRRAL